MDGHCSLWGFLYGIWGFLDRATIKKFPVGDGPRNWKHCPQQTLTYKMLKAPNQGADLIRHVREELLQHIQDPTEHPAPSWTPWGPGESEEARTTRARHGERPGRPARG